MKRRNKDHTSALQRLKVKAAKAPEIVHCSCDPFEDCELHDHYDWVEDDWCFACSDEPCHCSPAVTEPLTHQLPVGHQPLTLWDHVRGIIWRGWRKL